MCIASLNVLGDIAHYMYDDTLILEMITVMSNIPSKLIYSKLTGRG